MKAKIINCSLKNIQKTIKELETYRDSLEEKGRIFLERLADEGIVAAESHLGEYAGMVVFTKETEENGLLLIAADREKLLKVWYTDKKLTNERSYEVSPLLLAEFGSGWLAENLYDIGGVGQGTMPNSYGHAADRNGWYWYTEDGVKHHSIGEPPTHPMHYAILKMYESIERIAIEVYGGK